jgi:hypothetical protein
MNEYKNCAKLTKQQLLGAGFSQASYSRKLGK